MVYDLIIIGAGQAGLAAGYYARQAGLNFLILDSNLQVGDSWRKRYDSLSLFSPRSLNSLPGLKFQGRPSGYPSKNEAADYLQRYARHFKLPVKLGITVKSLTKDHTFRILTNQTIFHSQAVIVASGGFGVPLIPKLKGQLSSSVVQLAAAQYKNLHQIPLGRVLVVGAGNSGAAIASELAGHRTVTISNSVRPRFVSRRGGQIWLQVLFQTGAIYAGRQTWLGRRVEKLGLPVIGSNLSNLLKTSQVKFVPPPARLAGRKVAFTDGSSAEYKAVIWATGYGLDFSWIKINRAVKKTGQPLHHHGVSPIAGLYYLGLEWQRSRASALMGGVGRDARFIVNQIQSQAIK